MNKIFRVGDIVRVKSFDEIKHLPYCNENHCIGIGKSYIERYSNSGPYTITHANQYGVSLNVGPYTWYEEMLEPYDQYVDEDFCDCIDTNSLAKFIGI